MTATASVQIFKGHGWLSPCHLPVSTGVLLSAQQDALQWIEGRAHLTPLLGGNPEAGMVVHDYLCPRGPAGVHLHGLLTPLPADTSANVGAGHFGGSENRAECLLGLCLT